MPYAISPFNTDEDFPSGLSLNDKILLFSDRVEGWQLGIADELVKRDIPHRGFAILYILFSLFEMIGKYRDGFLEDRRSKEYFKKGVKFFYPWISDMDLEVFSKELYENVRNGVYHLGMTTPKVLLSGEAPGSLGYHRQLGIIRINPDMLVADLTIRFRQYIEELRDPRNADLRVNFERRFDLDNDIRKNKGG